MVDALEQPLADGRGGSTDGLILANAQTLHSSNRKEMLSDKFEYVMHGKIFKFRNTTQAGQPKVEVTISFGGLLLQIVGDASKLEVLELDTFIFLLIRKAS